MLVNTKEMLNNAKKEKYAIPHFNINNLEWTKYILEVCEELKEPVILGVSEGALKYMGGADVVVGMVKGLIKDLALTIPVAIHIDHCKSFEVCKEVIDAGFTSVMIDASKNELNKNIEITKKVVDYAHERGVTVEAEVGHIGGSEDDETSSNTNATLEECIKIYEKTGIDSLAPALGSVHGFYKGEPNLDFERMKLINETLPIPLVLHGGSGIPDYQITEAINCGTSKINVNTELQEAWAKGVKKFVLENEKEIDPRKIIGSGEENIKNRIKEKVILFRNNNFKENTNN